MIVVVSKRQYADIEFTLILIKWWGFRLKFLRYTAASSGTKFAPPNIVIAVIWLCCIALEEQPYLILLLLLHSEWKRRTGFTRPWYEAINRPGGCSRDSTLPCPYVTGGFCRGRFNDAIVKSCCHKRAVFTMPSTSPRLSTQTCHLSLSRASYFKLKSKCW